MDGSALTFHKVSVLPPVLAPDAIYFVRQDETTTRVVVTSATAEPHDLTSTVARFSQIFPLAAEWIVNHNLGAKPASVTVLSAGSVEVEANIVHTSDNQFVVQLNPPMAGQVIVQ